MSIKQSCAHSIEQRESDSFWSLFNSTILSPPRILWTTIFVAILSYGFVITHYSVSIDDPAAWHYLHTNNLGSMIQQGRLSHVLLEWLTGKLEFIPFFNDLVGVALFVFSALVLCVVFQYVTNQTFSSMSLAVFSGVYLSYSLINEKFIYNLDVIVTMLSYLAFAFAMLRSYQVVIERNIKALPGAVGWTILSISSYESFIFLYGTGTFFLFMLRIYGKKEPMTIGKVLVKGMEFLGILVAACIVYYGTVVVVQLATGQYGLFTREIPWAQSDSVGRTFQVILTRIVEGMKQWHYLPILVFDIVAVVGIGVSAFISIKGKTAAGFLCFLGFFATNFLIHLVSGQMLYRAAQGYCFFVAGVVLFVIHFLEGLKGGFMGKWPKKMAYVLAAYLIFMQAADLNQWFYNDYVRYKKEEFAIHAIATRLVSECDVSKPVVFTGKDLDSYLNLNKGCNQTNGNSMLTWGVGAFEDVTSPMMLEIFHMHGYRFLKNPSYQQAMEGQVIAQEMPPWPQKASIQEFDDIIVVNFQ